MFYRVRLALSNDFVEVSLMIMLIKQSAACIRTQLSNA